MRRFLIFLALALGLFAAPAWAGSTSTLAPTCLSPTTLSPTLLQPVNLLTLGCGGGGGVSCSQATTFVARTSGENNVALTTLICGLVTDGLITGDLTSAGTKCGSLFDRMYIHAMANSSDALLDVCGNASATANGSPSFTSNAGFLGVDSSSTVFLDTGLSCASGVNYTQNSAHLAAWSLTNSQATSTGGLIMGCDNTTTNTQILPWYSDGNTYVGINGGQTNVSAAATASSGYWVVNRTDSLNITGYRNGTSIGANSAATSTAPAALSMYILNRHNSGGDTAGGAAQTIAVSHFGATLTGTNITNLNSRFCTYLTTVHGSC